MTTGHPATRNTAWARPASARMPQLFVSYPRENKREVDELVDHLQHLNNITDEASRIVNKLAVSVTRAPYSF